MPRRRLAPLPVDAPFARAVLERIAYYRVEEHRVRALGELESLEADAAALQRLIGALQAFLPDREVKAIEERACKLEVSQ